jgi:hypothetical protein
MRRQMSITTEKKEKENEMNQFQERKKNVYFSFEIINLIFSSIRTLICTD